MAKPLKALIVEDSKDDTELLVYELRNAGYDLKWARVETEADYLKELKKSPDIILSDFSMPQFSGLRAAELARESHPDIPFILISGTVGEDIAVDAMKRGATDYLLKDRIVRLGTAVERALREAKERAERKQLQEEIVHRERQLHAFLSGATAGLTLIDKDLRYVQVNETLAQMNGVPVKEHVGRTVREVLPELAPKVEPLLKQVLATGKPLLDMEISGETPGQPNVQRYWTESLFPIFGKNGKPEYIGAIVVETTEQKKAQAEWRESELKFRQIAENIREVFWITDTAKNQIVYVSPAYESIWGRTCQSLYDSPRTWLDAIHPEDRNRVLEASLTKQSAGQYDETYRIIRPDGKERWIHDCAYPIHAAAGNVYRVVGVAEDITERRKLEEQFRQAQKMEAIGVLAGGVAHDFNNILAVIQMHCDLRSGELTGDQKESMDEISAAARRAAALTRQLLLFSRKEVMQPRDFDLNQSISNTTRMLRRILREDINLQFRFAMEPLFIHADAGMVDQVLMNLAVNSRDAMPEGGQLVIQTSAEKIDGLLAAQLPNARPGSFACVSVSDTGSGIAPEILPRIFEPFFTTKEAGKGTGLGLATVFGIVQQHQGWVNVQSELGSGTTFRIYFPLLAKTPELGAASPAAVIQGGHETILVAEDDEFLRMTLVTTLSQLGYKVLEAINGADALEVWAKHRDDISLLLTDLIMPGEIMGRKLAEQLLKENPKLKVIYMSGYHTEGGDDFRLEAGVNYLVKPFQTDELSAMVRARLDR